MAQAEHHAGPSMSLAARAAFTALPLAAFIALLTLLDTHPLILRGSIDWVPSLDVSLAWRIDGLSLLFLLLITGIGTAVFVYAGGYLHGHPQQQRLYVLLTLFMLAMVGCVTADNMIVLFLFWELTSLTSFLLVGFNHSDLAARKSAQQAFLVTGGGGLALLAGLILLGQAAGSYSLSDFVLRAPGLGMSPQIAVGIGLVMIGCFAKSAQFPFHFWLPNAMSAPTPVSAYLHSATMVKLGVYLLARLDPAFGHEGWWQAVLAAIGSVTAAWAMVLALRERDLKRILAWSTVAALGTLVMLIGLRGDGATVAVGAFILAHALYKAPLFFVAGNVDHGTGTRVIDRLGGLRGAMPLTAIAALLAGLSMAGLPTSFGYVAKDVIAVAKGELEGLAWISYANLFVSGVAVAVAGVAAVRVFWRHPGQSETCDAHEGGAALVLPPIVIALTGIVLGLLPDLASGVLREAARAMTPGIGGPDVALNLELGPVLGTVAATLVIGAAVFWFWDGLHALLERADPAFRRFGPAVIYQRSLDGLVRLAARSTRAVQHGSLPGYSLLMTGAVAVVLIVLLAAAWPQLAWPRFGWPIAQWPTPAIAGAALLLAAGALAACRIRDRLVLLLASGLVGYGSAALFLFTGAPDLAFTQFSVETVFVVVAATVLLKLKRLGRDQGMAEPRLRVGAAVVAIAFGSTLTLLLLAATGGAFDTSLPQFFGERSVPEAYGRNVVNVIIVDFRALDTLGEIAVVAFSLLAALPLLAALRQARRPGRMR